MNWSENSEMHTFVVCAYKESPYLENCLKSLKNQTVKSSIIMTTSTPNVFIKSLAEKYEVPLWIREGKSDIRDDWNLHIIRRILNMSQLHIRMMCTMKIMLNVY